MTSPSDSAAPSVADAMRAVPRASYLPAAQRENAASDTPLLLWDGVTNSQPTTVANMLELLEVPRGARVLDVGAGSGWTTALLAYLTGPSGAVLGLEILADLADWGAGNLAASGQPWARLEIADEGELGRAADGPYDRILVSAMATNLPLALVDQLAPGGILVIPVDGRMLRVHRPTNGGPTTSTEHGSYRFVPLHTSD